MNYRAIHDTIDKVADLVRASGLPLPDELKGRDRREPARVDKQDLEDDIVRTTGRHWRNQKAVIRDYLERNYPDRKGAPSGTMARANVASRDFQLPFDFLWDDDYYADMTKFVLVGVNGGIEIFKEYINLVMDYTMLDAAALEFARTYSYGLIKGIENTTRDIVAKAISAFIETPGFTIGDIMDLLPFGPVRAQMIAVTEVTRAFASGQMLAGRELENQYPGVPVVKTWFTNNDEFVCDICEPLDGAEVPLDEPFESGDDEPPAHVNCRCWMEVSTKIEDGAPVPVPVMRSKKCRTG